MVCFEFVRRLPARYDEKTRGRDSIVGLVHIQTMQMNGVAFWAWIREVELHRFAFGVFQKRPGQCDVTIRHPSIAPDGNGGAVRQERVSFHPRKKLRRLHLSMAYCCSKKRKNQSESSKLTHGATWI